MNKSPKYTTFILLISLDKTTKTSTAISNQSLKHLKKKVKLKFGGFNLKHSKGPSTQAKHLV